MKASSTKEKSAENDTIRLFKKYEKKYFNRNSVIVGVVESRHYRNANEISRVVQKLNAKPQNIVIASVDDERKTPFVKREALSFRIPYLEFTAEYESANKHTVQQGRRFGKRYDAQLNYKRNYELVRFVDLLVAFIPERYIGDKDSAVRAKQTVRKAKQLDTETMVMT